MCFKDDNNLKCVRFVLEYCAVFEDRGCVSVLPHLLNKLYSSDYQDIIKLESDFAGAILD